MLLELPHAASARRLHRSADVRAVFASPHVGHAATLVVHALRRGDDEPARWTVVAGRKVGGAVERNRAKRRLRAAIRAHDLPPGVDVVVVARPRALDAPFERLTHDLTRALRSAIGPEGTSS